MRRVMMNKKITNSLWEGCRSWRIKRKNRKKYNFKKLIMMINTFLKDMISNSMMNNDLMYFISYNKIQIIHHIIILFSFMLSSCPHLYKSFVETYVYLLIINEILILYNNVCSYWMIFRKPISIDILLWDTLFVFHFILKINYKKLMINF